MDSDGKVFSIIGGVFALGVIFQFMVRMCNGYCSQRLSGLSNTHLWMEYVLMCHDASCRDAGCGAIGGHC